jgi:hypothetical protein
LYFFGSFVDDVSVGDEFIISVLDNSPFDCCRSRRISDEGEERCEEFFSRVSDVAIVFVFLDLELALATFDVNCQPDCIEIGPRTGIRLQSAPQCTCHPACEITPDMLGHRLGRTLLAPLPTVRTPKAPLIDQLEGTLLGILGVDGLALAIHVGGLCA